MRSLRYIFDVETVRQENTPLNIILLCRSLFCVQDFIASGLEMCDQHMLSEASPIMDLHTLACFAEGFDAFKEALMINCYDMNKVNCAGWTPLMFACAAGNMKAVEILVELQADETVRDATGQSAFMIAAMNGREDILDLLSGGLYIEMANHQGWTPLIGALTMGNHTTGRYLVKKGANVNAIAGDSGASPLMLAAADGEEHTVEVLLTYGADPTFISKDLKTAADIAEEHGYADLANYLGLQETYCGLAKWDPPKDLLSLLISMNEEKFWPLFEGNLVNLERFLRFSEDDLREIGISLLGPRKKMIIAIECYKSKEELGLHII